MRKRRKKKNKLISQNTLAIFFFFFFQAKTVFYLNDTKLSHEHSSVAWQLKEKVKSPEKEKCYLPDSKCALRLTLVLGSRAFESGGKVMNVVDITL